MARRMKRMTCRKTSHKKCKKHSYKMMRRTKKRTQYGGIRADNCPPGAYCG